MVIKKLVSTCVYLYVIVHFLYYQIFTVCDGTTILSRQSKSLDTTGFCHLFTRQIVCLIVCQTDVNYISLKCSKSVHLYSNSKFVDAFLKKSRSCFHLREVTVAPWCLYVCLMMVAIKPLSVLTTYDRVCHYNLDMEVLQSKEI